ncbi:GNAT family N-acetyltransferase [Vibrio profundi]|uniref:GNAT family N-acetyltransferase n=1 Tax=Vibrio profundi TaxID=1774960 RepID=UPI003735FC3F
MEIRKLTSTDWCKYKALRLLSLKESPQSFENGMDDELPLTDEQWKVRVTPSNESFIVGTFVNGELVAIAGFSRGHKKKTSHKSYLWGVFVDLSYRGKGMATDLLQFILSEFENLDGVDQIQLTVGSENKEAIGLYQKLGFKHYGIEIDSLRINGVSYDELLMCRSSI